jgi:hypothetical protein
MGRRPDAQVLNGVRRRRQSMPEGRDAMQPLRELLGFDPKELSGAHVAGAIPLKAGLLNALIAERLSTSSSAVASVAIEPAERETFVAHVRLRASIVPPLRITLRIEQQPSFPDSPVLVMRWSMGAIGALARFATPALAKFDVLPPGVRVDGDLIGVDVAELLRSRGAGELLQYIAMVRVRTEAGRAIVEFEVRG